MDNLFKITVLASGGPGYIHALLEARKELNIEILNLIVNRECNAMAIAQDYLIPILKVRTTNVDVFVNDLNTLIHPSTDLIVLAGFLPIIPKAICDKWFNKIINIHPSLLPKHGGKGMYGKRIQEAVLLNKEKTAGCTIHFVNHEIDGGQIIMQKSVDVLEGDTPWVLGGRVFAEETKLLINAIRFLKGKVHRCDTTSM